MTKRMLLGVCLLLLLPASPAIAYSIVSVTTTQVAPHIERTDWVVAPSANPVENFSMHRVVRTTGHHVEGTIIMPYPLCCDFRAYEFTHDGAYDNSFAGFLAEKKVEVWGYSGRGHMLPPGYCDTNDCSIAGTWTFAVHVADIEFIRSYIMANYPPEDGKKPAIGGFSLGAMLAIAAVNANPTGYSGLVILEGSMHTANAADIAYTAQGCADADAQLAAGVTMIDNSLLKGLATASQTNDVLHDTQFWPLMIAPPPIQPLRALTDYYFTKAGETPGSYAFSIRARTTGFFASSMTAYFPNAALRDVPCALAGETTHKANLVNYHGPVLAIGGTKGFGQTYGALMSIIGSSDKTVQVLAGYGHLDHYAASDHLKLVEKPVWKWLKSKVF